MTNDKTIFIATATTPQDYAVAASLFKAYQQELGVDLCFLSFQQELENLPAMYGEPKGCLLLAKNGDDIIGCVALRPKEAGQCEMKRLYVQPAFRKFKIGDALVAAILKEAERLGYAKMKLDTLERLQPAIRLYLKHGFEITTAYYHNPLPEVVYMEKPLNRLSITTGKCACSNT